MKVQVKFNKNIIVNVPFDALIDNNDSIHPDCYTLSENGDLYFFTDKIYIFKENKFHELEHSEISKLNVANHKECISVSCSK